MKLMVLLFALMVMASADAHAQVVVSEGDGAGRDCYVHAKFGHDLANGLKVCNIALDQGQSITDRAATFDNRGIILNRLGRFDEAASDFRRAVTLQPELGDAYINIGSTLIRQKSYDEALV